MKYFTFIGKAIPIQAYNRPRGFQEVEAPRFWDSQHMKMARLSALCTGRLYPPDNIPDTHFPQRLSQPQGHSAATSIMSMKNANDTNGNRTCDLPACSAVPQPTAVFTFMDRQNWQVILSMWTASISPGKNLTPNVLIMKFYCIFWMLPLKFMLPLYLSMVGHENTKVMLGAYCRSAASFISKLKPT
jgi:hypothetical protein